MRKDVDQEQFLSIMNREKALSTLQEYFEFQQHYNAAIHEVRTKLEVLNDEFAVKHDHNPIHSIESRLKSVKSIANKLNKNGFEISIASARKNLFDIAGIRVICCYVDDIYYIADILSKQDDIKVLKVKDYIKNPKPNGYRSLHLVLKIPIFLSTGPIDIPVEIQIRTVAMDFWASLEHELRYKTNNEFTEASNSELLECAKLISSLDERMQKLYRETQKKTDE